MSLATANAFPRTAGSTLIESVQEAKKQERAQKRENSRVRRLARQLLIAVAVLFAAVGIGAGTASAAPWDIKEDLEASISYFCRPMDLPLPTSQSGIDTALGLNQVENSDRRQTVIPDAASVATMQKPYIPRMEGAYADKVDTIKPTYERYGFTTLRWDNYGGNCFSPYYWFNLLSNTALTIMVHLPTIFAMLLLDLAMGNVLYDVYTAIIAFPVSIFTSIFVPWIYVVAPIGALIVFIRTHSVVPTMKAGLWAFLMLGTVLWMSNNTSTAVRTANNFVTELANQGASMFNGDTTPTPATNESMSSATDRDPDDGVSGETAATPGMGALAADNTEATSSNHALSEVNQALWYGVPYQAWLEGSIGPAEAAKARTIDRGSTETPSWGATLLNGNYVGPDTDGGKVTRATLDWNSRSYMNDGNDTKTDGWTDEALWKESPYLFNIKVMCGDTVAGGNGSNAPRDNMWMYNGECKPSLAHTTSMIEHFQGKQYSSRIVTAMAGGVASGTVLLASGGAALYLAVQKMLFYFLLMFAPVFLTISSFGDEKRAAIGKRYFELMGANIIKQVVAVLVVLFISNAMSMLMYPPSGEAWAAIRNVPWMVKPVLAVLFFIALLMFARPMTKIISGAAKGDTSVVDRTARAPLDMAKTSAKVAGGGLLLAGAAAATIATGGAAAPALAKGAGVLSTAGRAAGRGATGRALRRAGSLTSMAAAGNEAVKNRTTDQGAIAAGTAGMLNGPKGASIREEIGRAGGIGPDGQFNAAGQDMAKKMFKKTAKEGQKANEADARQDAFMTQFYAGHKAKTGEFHKMDPNSPENKRAAAVAAAREKEEIKSQVEHTAKKQQNTAGAGASGVGSAADSGAQGVESAAGATNGEGTNGSTAAGAATTAAAAGAAGKSDGETDTTSAAQTATKAAYAAQARDNVSGPAFTRDENLTANVTADGDQVLSKMGLTREEAAANPAELLLSAYNEGDPTAMDPRHPATQHLNEMRFAMVNGTDEEVEAASVRASEAIVAHGVPSQISAVGSVGAAAESFESVQIVGAMPSINENTPWQERVEASNTMQAAAMTLPMGDPATEPVNAYVSALSNPAVDVPEVEALRTQAIDALASSDAVRGAEAPQEAGFLVGAAVATPAAAGLGAAAASAAPAPASAEPAPTPEQGAAPVASAAAPAAPAGHDQVAPVAAPAASYEQGAAPVASAAAPAAPAGHDQVAPVAAPAASYEQAAPVPASAPVSEPASSVPDQGSASASTPRTDAYAPAAAAASTDAAPAATPAAPAYEHASGAGANAPAAPAPEQASAPAPRADAYAPAPEQNPVASAPVAYEQGPAHAPATGADAYVAGPEQGPAASAPASHDQAPATYEQPAPVSYDQGAAAAGPAYSTPSWDQAPVPYADRPSFTDDVAPADFRDIPGYSDADYAERVRYEDSYGPVPHNPAYDGFQGHPSMESGWSAATHDSGAPLIAPVPTGGSGGGDDDRSSIRQEIREGIRDARREEPMGQGSTEAAASAPAAAAAAEGPSARGREQGSSAANVPGPAAETAEPQEEPRRYSQGVDERRSDEDITPYRPAKRRRRRSVLFETEDQDIAPEGEQEDEN